MWRTPPFARAPLLLLRHRLVLVAILGAAAILGVVVALTPQFLSSAASSAYERELEGRCDASYNGRIDPHFGSFLPVNDENRSALSEAAATHPNLGDPIATVIGPSLNASTPSGSDFTLVPIHRTGFRDRIDVLEGGGPGGVWIDEYAASTYDIALGDEIEFTATLFTHPDGEEQIEGSLTVTAITLDKVDLRATDYWCGLEDYLGLTAMGDRKPPVGLIDLAVLQEQRLDRASGEYWEVPVEIEGLSLTRVEEILGVFGRISEDLLFGDDNVVTDITGVRERVIAVRDALETSVRPLSLVVTMVSLGLLAGAASYWVDRRRPELEMLHALGVGPVATATKALLEMALPVAVGLAFGVALSLPVGDAVGPGGTIDAVARQSGAWRAIPSFAIAMGVVGLVVLIRSSRLAGNRRRRSSLAWIGYPLVAGLVVAAFLLRRGLEDGTVVFGENDLVGSVDPLVMLFPVLIFGAVAVAAARVMLFAIELVRPRVKSHAGYLAVRRLLSGSAPAVVLFAAALLPAATLIYSATLTRSAEATVQAKGRVFIGSDVRAPVFRMEPLPAGLADRATYVGRAERVDYIDTEIDFMVVDTDTFARGAFWEPSFSSQPLDALMSSIAPINTPLPALIANAGVSARDGLVQLGRIAVPVEIVADASSFPGARVDRPILVVSRAAFDSYLEGVELPPSGSDGTNDFLWIRGDDYEEIELALNEADIGFAFTTTVAETLDLTKFQVIIWTFDFLELYAGLAGLIVIGAILLYSDTRQRSRNLSYALATRMGLRRGEHVMAGMIEMGSLLLAGTITGSIAAVLAARSIYSTLDALPSTPPEPIWRTTYDLIAVLVVVAALVTLATAAASQRTADSADVAALLRHGD